MSLIQVNNVGHSVDAGPLFSEVSFTFTEQSRVALVGQNGSGKSTLLKILGGEIQPDEGQVTYRRGAIVEYVPQSLPDGLRDLTLKDALMQRIEQRGIHVEEWMVDCTLSQLRFRDSQFSTQLGRLSGGEVNRAMLGRALIVDPQFLLLDEPTNHLDSEGIIQFEGILRELEVPFCVVSHDRELLDNCCRETLFLRDHRLYHIRAPFSQARLELDKLDRAAADQRAKEERELDRLKDAATQLQVWARLSDKVAPRYRAMLTRVAKAEENLTFVTREKKRNLALDAGAVRANHIVSLRDMGISVPNGRQLFSLEDFTVSPGDRIAILGKNGTGKSTFLRTLVTAFRNQDQSIRFTPQTRLGYFDQELAELDPNRTLVSHITKMTDVTTDRATRELVSAGFPYRRHETKISTLSGGEKARLQFLAIKLANSNLLVLDEPTNHIDVQGVEMLEDDLLSSQGTVLFVSHDRRFVTTVATRFFLIHEGKLREIRSVEPYYELLAHEDDSEPAAHPGPARQAHASSKSSAPKSPEGVMQEIETLEARLRSLDANSPQAQALSLRLQRMYENLEGLI